jgi:hypothetical protein
MPWSKQTIPTTLPITLFAIFCFTACSDEVDSNSGDTGPNGSGFELGEECLLLGDPRCEPGGSLGNLQSSQQLSMAADDLFYNLTYVQFPPCMNADGLGREHCAPHFQEANLHSHCVPPEDVPEGSEPCIWWILGTANESETHCWYVSVCVPEEMLAELGWPEGAGFDFHLGCGSDVCDPSTWPEDVEVD